MLRVYRQNTHIGLLYIFKGTSQTHESSNESVITTLKITCLEL